MEYRAHHAGRDALGRDVLLVFVPVLRDVARLEFPPVPFVFFLGGDTSGAIPEPLFEVAQAVLSGGAAYVLCWGPGSSLAEDLFDEAIVGDARSDAFTHVMTTSHEDETISDALEFATTVAIPHESVAAACRVVLVVFTGNVNWYNEGQNCLEDLLA